MLRYITLRLAGLIGVLLAVSALTFFLMHAIPGGPFDAQALAQNKVLPTEVITQLNIKYGLDKPLVEQYLTFMLNAVRLDFGYSFTSQTRTVTQIIADQWPYSIQLGLLTLVFSMIIGLGLGLGAAIKQGTWLDYLGTTVSIFCMVMPGFVFAILLQFVFAVRLHWLPTGGWDKPATWVLPVLANSLAPILTLQRFTKSSMVDAMRANYVRTARAKGLSEQRVMLIHVLKNALSPVITVGGPMAASLVIGSFFIEKIFQIPGIGFYWVNAIQTRDYPMIMASTLIWTALITITYLLTDLAYALIDPRVAFVKES
ncbi:MAG: ABC transporter permease [Chloroflexi bacterium]|nr:ABC transporter permease [Chloroflexota bacterium]